MSRFILWHGWMEHISLTCLIFISCVPKGTDAALFLDKLHYILKNLRKLVILDHPICWQNIRSVDNTRYFDKFLAFSNCNICDTICPRAYFGLFRPRISDSWFDLFPWRRSDSSAAPVLIFRCSPSPGLWILRAQGGLDLITECYKESYDFL